MSVRAGTTGFGTASVAGATLPFTGLPVAVVAAIGLLILLAGFVVYQTVRPTSD